MIERERAAAADREHAREFFPGETDQVGVLGVKLVHEPFGRRTLVLRNFLNEGFVVKPVDLFELPVFRREFENEGLP